MRNGSGEEREINIDLKALDSNNILILHVTPLFLKEENNYIPALKYNWLTKLYDPILQLTMPERKFKIALIDQMNIKPRDSILDFGCGSLTLSLIAKRQHPLSELFGVDVDSKILKIASEKLRRSGASIDIRRYDGDILPYGDQAFDRVMSSLVFHHLTLEQKLKALLEIKRVLKPDGELHIADFGKPSNVFQRIGFYGVQLLDGFETTSGNVKGLLPNVMEEAGFVFQATTHFKTAVGTVRLMKGTKK